MIILEFMLIICAITPLYIMYNSFFKYRGKAVIIRRTPSSPIIRIAQTPVPFGVRGPLKTVGLFRKMRGR